MTAARRQHLMLALATAAWVLFTLLTHTDYAVTWDEPPWFAYGETQRTWLLHGEADAPIQDPQDFFHYGALPALVAATGRWLVHDTFGLVAGDPAWHAGNLAFSWLLGAGIVVWAWSTLGARGATWAILLWCAWPRLWPDWHNNISDLPGAAVGLWAAWAAWRTIEDPADRWRNYLRMGVLIGLAYATRAPNVYFLVGLIGVWLVWLRLTGRTWPARIYSGTALTFAVAILTVKAASPPFWHRSVLQQLFYLNPKAYVRGTVGLSALWYNGAYYPGGAVPRTYALYTFLVSTPLVMLGLLGATIVAALRQVRTLPSHVSLWLILGLGAIGKHLLGPGNYDGVRHFLEAFAPLTLAVAWSVEGWWRAEAARGWRRAAVLTAAVTVAAFVPPLVTAVRIHPFQTGYFNRLAGPLATAWNDFEVDYWGQGLVEAAARLTAESGDRPARIYMPFADHLMERQVPAHLQVVEMLPEVDLDAAAPGDWMVLPNRRGKLIARGVSGDCPPEWQVAHEIRVRPDLPAVARICRR